VASLLLEKGANVNFKDIWGATPLFWAAETRHEAMVKLLLDKGADLRITDVYGQTPLSVVVENGNRVVIKLLRGTSHEPRNSNYTFIRCIAVTES
jgi:ankyrin repeat protein